MKWISLSFALLALLSLVNIGESYSIPKITIKNGDITVHGNCYGCTAKTSKNTASLSWKYQTRTTYTRRG
ncbi:hypothetical protein KR018_009909 [Drosophila ironensis]|nr:hypothetical protein KR018_009909 [Drosophila ironensis]